VAISRTISIDVTFEGDDSSPDDRATVRPPFDPADFARESERRTMRPDADAPSQTPEVGSASIVVETLAAQETSVPRLAVAHEDLEWFELSPNARRMLEFVDGAATLEVICIRMGLPLTEGMDAIEVLTREGLVVCA
jgi:hypothetical protein